MRRELNVDEKIKIKKKDLPIEIPVIVRVNEFSEVSAKNFSEDMQKAHETSQPIIPIVIDSYGGAVDALLCMMSEIENSRLPVATVCQGKAMSCGAVLLSCGTQNLRFVDPNARIMIHEISGYNGGKNEEIQVSAAEISRLNKQIFKKMARNCGQEENYFLGKMKERANTDWYLSPAQARKCGLVNHIRIPTLKINIVMNIVLE